jgi:hypothetical protein
VKGVRAGLGADFETRARASRAPQSACALVPRVLLNQRAVRYVGCGEIDACAHKWG